MLERLYTNIISGCVLQSWVIYESHPASEQGTFGPVMSMRCLKKQERKAGFLVGNRDLGYVLGVLLQFYSDHPCANCSERHTDPSIVSIA